MVEDLLSASRCELKKGITLPVESVFPDIAQAVNAARRITRLIRSFCGASEEGALDGCLTLSRVTEPAPALDLPLLQQTRILEATRPGQVFFVGAVCEETKTVPGLRFTELSGGVVKARRAGTRNVALQLLPPSGMEEAEGKPIVFKPTRPKPAVQPAAVASEPVGIPVGRPADEVERPAQFKTEQVSKSAGLVWSSVLSATKTFLQQTLPARLPNVGRKVAITVIAVIAALTAAIYLGHSRSQRVSLEPPTLVETTTSRPAQAKPSEQSSTPQEPTGIKDLRKAAPSSQPKAYVASSPPSTKAKRADRGHDRPQLDAESGVAEAPDEKTVNRSGVSFSPAEINNLIGKADQEVGDGNFDAAITNYRIVLKHDPANIRAKQGIERARRNKGSE
jgi:hypothetical protein